MEPERRPIGYWLKHLDRLIDPSATCEPLLTRGHYGVGRRGRVSGHNGGRAK
jgi:hypothetical protein